MAIGNAIGIPFGGNTIDPQAKATYDYIIADGGIVPAGLKALSDMFKLVKAYRGVNDITQAVKSWHHPHYGIKLAAGTGATSGNRACGKVYNLVNPTNAATQATPANQPLALVHNGTNYAWLPGAGGNGFTTPNSTNNELLDDFSFEFFANETNTNGCILGKNFAATANASFYILKLSGGAVRLGLSTNGTSYFTYDSNTTASKYFRISRNSTTGIIKFFTSTNGTLWTQLGADIIGIVGSLFNPNVPLTIGALNTALNQNVFRGSIEYVKLFKDDSFTTATQIFNPANYNRSVSQTQWTSSTGEVWTINTDSVTTGLKTAICDTTMVIGNGTSYGLQNSVVSFNESAITHHCVLRKYNNTTLAIASAIGNSAGAGAGYYLAVNEGSNNTEGVSGYATVANGRNYTSISTIMKICTAYFDTTIANPETDYYVNNTQATPVSQINTGNNTSNMVATGLNLLANNNAASLWLNGELSCDMFLLGIDTPTQRTAMFNILKTQFNL